MRKSKKKIKMNEDFKLKKEILVLQRNDLKFIIGGKSKSSAYKTAYE